MGKFGGFLALAALPLAAQVTLKQEADRITVSIGGKPYTALYTGSEYNKPFLHPLLSADGKQVTRNFPMAKVAGERHDHPHQRGCWFSHGNVNGYDFWSNEKSQWTAKTGRIVLKKVVKLESGKKTGALVADFDWQDNAGKALLRESKKISFRDDPRLRTLDFDITLEPVVEVTFEDTKEGTFAMRIAASLEEPEKDSPSQPRRTGLMVNAEGLKGEKQVWGKRSNWVDYTGEVDGEKLGIAIFDHPENPRHPTWWHSRSYGLFAANPFGVHDFENDKEHPHKGDMKMEPGHPVRFRYRLVIHPAGADIAEMYQQYARAR